MNIFGHFSVFSKCAGEINEVSDCLEMEGESSLRQAPSRSYPREDVEVQACCKITYFTLYFESMGQEECLPLMCKYTEDKNGEEHHQLK